MSKRVRVCGASCHNAKGTQCACFCQGFFHGKDGPGATNRAALAQATEEEQLHLLEEHGFKKGETAYKDQLKLALEV